MNFKARRIFAIAFIFPAISLLIFFIFTSPLFAGSHDEKIKIGVRTHSSAEAALKKWCPTADYLSHKIKGNPLRSFGTVQDITERHLMEEELKKHREHLEHLVEERTAELEERNAELERMSSAFVVREFRIKELRDRVKELELKIAN